MVDDITTEMLPVSSYHQPALLISNITAVRMKKKHRTDVESLIPLRHILHVILSHFSPGV